MKIKKTVLLIGLFTNYAFADSESVWAGYSKIFSSCMNTCKNIAINLCLRPDTRPQEEKIESWNAWGEGYRYLAGSGRSALRAEAVRLNMVADRYMRASAWDSMRKMCSEKFNRFEKAYSELSYVIARRRTLNAKLKREKDPKAISEINAELVRLKNKAWEHSIAFVRNAEFYKQFRQKFEDLGEDRFADRYYYKPMKEIFSQLGDQSAWVKKEVAPRDLSGGGLESISAKSFSLEQAQMDLAEVSEKASIYSVTDMFAAVGEKDLTRFRRPSVEEINSILAETLEGVEGKRNEVSVLPELKEAMALVNMRAERSRMLRSFALARGLFPRLVNFITKKIPGIRAEVFKDVDGGIENLNALSEQAEKMAEVLRAGFGYLKKGATQAEKDEAVGLQYNAFVPVVSQLDEGEGNRFLRAFILLDEGNVEIKKMISVAESKQHTAFAKKLNDALKQYGDAPKLSVADASFTRYATSIGSKVFTDVAMPIMIYYGPSYVQPYLNAAWQSLKSMTGFGLSERLSGGSNEPDFYAGEVTYDAELRKGIDALQAAAAAGDSEALAILNDFKNADQRLQEIPNY